MMIFSMAISHLKGHLLKLMNDRVEGFTDTDILWVLTIPALWSEPAKQFMREASVMVCYVRETLRLNIGIFCIR